MTIQQSPYMRLQRNFPHDNPQALTIEIDRFHVEAATKMNAREIGTYATGFPIVNGQQWFISGEANKQQALRQLYPFTATGNIAHGINWASVFMISPNSYGTFTDGTNWYGAIYASNTAIAGQISFYVTSTNIVVLGGAGAPTITQGYLNLEWISQT